MGHMRILLRGPLAALGVFLVTGCATDQDILVSNIEVVGYGVFEYSAVRHDRDDTSSVGAEMGAAKGLQLSSQTDRIPIRPGLAYGIRFVVHGSPPDAAVQIRVILTSTNPCVLRNTGRIVYQNDSVLDVRIGETRHIGGRFPMSEEENHCIGEAQPGTNTLELYFGKRKLAEQVFQIVKE